MRNCTRDEGRSFAVGNQVLISSHRKLLSLTATVVNVAGKAETRFRQARLREANVSEPSMKCRNRISCHGRPRTPGGMKRGTLERRRRRGRHRLGAVEPAD